MLGVRPFGIFARMTFTLGMFFSAKHLDASSLYERMVRSNELFLVQESIRPFLTDAKVKRKLEMWLSHYKNEAYVVDCQFHLRAFFRDPNTIGPICYYLRQDAVPQRARYLNFAKAYILEIKSALDELAEDPRYSDSERSKAKQYLQAFGSFKESELSSCFEPVMSTNWPKPGEALNYTPFSKVSSCLNQSFAKINGSPYFAVNLPKEFSYHPGHAISPTGWISGNKVTHLHWNNTSVERQKELENIHGQMKRYYPLTGAGSLETMRSRDLNSIFTEAEGFSKIDNHPVWKESQNGAIFPEIKKSLDQAESTVFIDIFFLGSSMGVSLAKHLIGLAEKGIKVLILRDNYNHFGHEPEMRPVFNYLAAYSEKNPSKLVISGSYIKGHTSGLPEVAASLVSDAFLEKSGLQSHLNLYGRAQSDHSKVFVIDGAGKNPVAFVGSKNLTDASGALIYDEVAKVEGPAAAVIQDDFYWDIVHALKYEMPDAHLSILASNGWSSKQYRSGQSKDSSAWQIAQPFDLLNRNDKGIPSSSKSLNVEAKGQTILRTGYNNVNSTRTNCVDEVVQMILFAKKNIYIKDQYLFDRSVILALLAAKSRNPNLDIRAILEPMNRANPRGLPNILYLDYLKAAGISVRMKNIVDGTVIQSQYHMKTISADGRSVIIGSANKDQTTMYGSFREEQVDVWDEAVTKSHDDNFLSHWNDQESELFKGYDFQVPYSLKGIDGKPLTPDQFISSVRDVVSILFDAR